MKRKLFPVFFSILILFFSCSKKAPVTRPEIEGLVFDHALPLEYAKTFRADIYRSSEHEALQCPLITVSGGDTYLLVPQEAGRIENLPLGIKLITYPLDNVYLCASSAMSLLARLNSLDSVGFSAVQKKDWYVEEARTAMEQKKILYAGKYNSPDFELLVNRKCPLAIESTMIYHMPQILEKLEALGISVFVDKSSYEEEPLGRLEWIKLYGLLFGKLDEAESFFNSQIKKIQLQTQSESEVKEEDRKTIAFFYITPTGTVVIRGSDDYIVKMIELSGGKYAFNKVRKSRSPSIQISMEEFYVQGAAADILIYNSSIDNSVHSMADLLSRNQLLSEFKAVKNGEVWATGKYLYQATDRIGDMILDLNAIIHNETDSDSLNFLTKVE